MSYPLALRKKACDGRTIVVQAPERITLGAQDVGFRSDIAPVPKHLIDFLSLFADRRLGRGNHLLNKPQVVAMPDDRIGPDPHVAEPCCGGQCSCVNLPTTRPTCQTSMSLSHARSCQAVIGKTPQVFCGDHDGPRCA